MASQRVKGITIEIGGDTTQLTKALTSVDKASKETQTNLRDINKALKFDSGNVDLLKAKQENLNDAVSQAKERLKAEKDALDQMKNSDGFDANSKAAKDLETQIALDTAELKKAEDELKNFGSVGQQQMKVVAEKVKEVGDKLSSIGSTLTKTVTAPIVGIGAASVAAWQEVDSAMDIVITKTGATGAALDDMQSRVTNIAETIPTSFEEAGTAIGEVNTRFGLTGDALEDLSTKFIQFANLNGTDVNSSIDSVQKTMAAFGLSADQAGALLDTLNQVGQNTGISMDTLSSLMTSNATAFQSLGLNAADAANLLGTLETSGIDTSVAITGLTKVQKEAATSGKSMEEALTGALTDVNSAVDVFGSKAGVKLYESFKNGTLSIDDFVKSTASLDDALGSVSETYTATLDPMDQMQTTMNTLKQTGADIVNSSAPMITQAMQALADVVKRLSDAWNNLSPAQQEMIVKLALVAAAVGPVLTVIGKVITIVSTIMPIITAIGGVITGTVIPAIAAISAPVLAVVAAIAAVIAIIVVCVKHWDEIKEAAGKAAEYISQKWGEFKENMAQLWDGIKQKTSETWDNIKQKTSETADNMSKKWSEFKEDTAKKWEQTSETVKRVSIALAKIGIEKFGELKTGVSNKVNEIKTNVLNTFNNLKSGIASVIGNIKNTIVNGFQGAISFITSLPSKALGWGRDIINGLIDGIRNAIGGLKDAMSNIAETISSFIHFSEPDVGPLSNFHTYMPDMMKEIASGITKGIPEVETAMNSLSRSMIPQMGGVSSSGMAAGGTTNNTNSVSINVYGSAGQDVNELANIIEQKITDNVVRRGVAFV